MPAPTMVDLAAFSALMEEALERNHMPRAYLLPSQTQRSGHAEPTFKPAIDARSKVREGRRCRACGMIAKVSFDHTYLQEHRWPPAAWSHCRGQHAQNPKCTVRLYQGCSAGARTVRGVSRWTVRTGRVARGTDARIAPSFNFARLTRDNLSS